MRIAIALIPLVLFAALAAVFFKQLAGGGSPSIIPSALIGKQAPQFSLPGIADLVRDGAPMPGLTTEDFAGKFTVLNVWASWCVPCREEHPALVEFARDKRFTLYGINYKDKSENARRFLGQLGNPFAAIGADIRGRSSIDWGVYGIPETFVVGPDAKILFKHVGRVTPAVLKKLVGVIEARAGK